PISPRSLQIALPDAASVILQDSLAALRTHQQIKCSVDDLPFGPESGQFTRLPDQALIDHNVGSAHGNSIHHFVCTLCICRMLVRRVHLPEKKRDAASRVSIMKIESRQSYAASSGFGVAAAHPAGFTT